jgi:quercetin dioxygenase-like cupin family protein
MKRIIIGLAAAAILVTGVAVATPTRGFTATLLGATSVDHISIDVDDPSNVVFARVEIEAGGTSGWHSHPSQVFVLVESGRAVHVDGETCERKVLRKGDVFVETPGEVHKIVTNRHRSATFIVNFVGLPPETPTLISEPNPCGN